MEGDETEEAAIRRECFEEAGVKITIPIELGYIREIKNEYKMVQNSQSYFSHVIGEKNIPQFTLPEKDQ